MTTTATRERPILFSGPMVRAIMDGRKTMTRRVVKLTSGGHVKEPGGHRRWHPADPDAVLACPYGQPGDTLLVKEAHRWLRRDRDSLIVRYEADGAERAFRFDELPEDIIAKATAYTRGTLRQGRFLHNALVRYQPDVVSVRVERVQNISEADAVAEGVATWDEGGALPTATEAFAELWNSINSARGFGWDANPWVWVVEFRRVDQC